MALAGGKSLTSLSYDDALKCMRCLFLESAKPEEEVNYAFSYGKGKSKSYSPHPVFKGKGKKGKGAKSFDITVSSPSFPSSSAVFDGNCNFCGKYGHKASNCRKRMRNEKVRAVTEEGPPDSMSV